MAKKSNTDHEQDIMLAKIEKTLESLLEKQELTYAEVKKTNGRVTTLETWRSKMQGAYAAVVVVSTLVGFGIGIVITIYVK
jgi:hypothetical protein